MLLPLYPKPGTETVINLPGHYKGYFANWPPTSRSRYKFKAADNWKVISCVTARGGSHGGCSSCYMILIELKYVEEHKEVKQELPEIMILTEKNSINDYCADEPTESNTKIDVFKGIIIGIILFIILKVIK